MEAKMPLLPAYFSDKATDLELAKSNVERLREELNTTETEYQEELRELAVMFRQHTKQISLPSGNGSNLNTFLKSVSSKLNVIANNCNEVDKFLVKANVDDEDTKIEGDIRKKLNILESFLEISNNYNAIKIVRLGDVSEMFSVEFAGGLMSLKSEIEQFSNVKRGYLQSSFDIKFITSIEKEIKQREELLIEVLIKNFEDAFKFHEDEKDGHSKITISVIRDKVLINKIFECLYLVGNPKDKVKKLEQYFESFLNTVASKISLLSDYQFDENEKEYCFCFESKPNSKMGDHTVILSFLKVFTNNLISSLEHLNVWGMPEDSITLLSHIGIDLGREIISILKKRYLKAVLPFKMEDQSTFASHLKGAAKLVKSLELNGMCTDADSILKDYSHNLPKLIIEAKYYRVLQDCRNHILSKLETSVGIGGKEEPKIDERETFNKALSQSTRYDILKFVYWSGGTISKYTISKSVGKMMHAIRGLAEDLDGTDDGELRVFIYTGIRNIVKMYCTLVPRIHLGYGTVYSSLPALLFNNSMYILHTLLKYNLLKEGEEEGIVVKELRTLAIIGIDDWVDSVLTDIMKELKNGVLITSSERQLSTIDAFKMMAGFRKYFQAKCVELYQMFNTVMYEEVLTYISITIINTVSHLILSVSDFGSDQCDSIKNRVEDLLEILDKGFKKANPQLNLIGKAFEETTKLKEIIFCLHNPMSEIEKRYCDGMGILGEYLTKHEIKDLIRAVFQNTDRRAETLARII